MTLIQTAQLDPTLLTPNETHQVYCGLDNCVTAEALTAELSYLSQRPHSRHIYNFERALQAPYLEIMLRGFPIDLQLRQQAIDSLKERIDVLITQLLRLTSAVSDYPFNSRICRSTSQLPHLFYDILKFPELWTSKKGVRKKSMDRMALEKLYETYLYARPFINHILAIRDLEKQCEVLEHDVDSDGRFRSSYNIAGTETGRSSSSINAFGTGGNAQNIAPSLRNIFVPSPGHKLVVIDYEQSESRDVGFLCGCLFNDWTFLDACESFDLHTNTAKLVWPELRWPGSPEGDKKTAQQRFYRDFSYRDMAKRGGHLSTYMGTAWTMARHLKITQQVAEDFQSRFCRGYKAAFPVIPRYWQWAAQQIQTTYKLVTPLGRERHFFGNTSDDTTLREAIAFIPQSTTADRTNLGFWRVWKHLGSGARGTSHSRCELLAQGYDSITFQALDDRYFNDVVAEAKELLRLELRDPRSGRKFEVPCEAKVGLNWQNASPSNPQGLAKWQADDASRRRPVQ